MMMAHANEAFVEDAVESPPNELKPSLAMNEATSIEDTTECPENIRSFHNSSRIDVSKTLAEKAAGNTPDRPPYSLRPQMAQTQKTKLSLTGLSSIYALFIVAVYVGLLFTEQVDYGNFAYLSESNGFLLYLFIVADIFLVYLLVLAFVGNAGKIRLLEHTKSHGSLSVRIGAVVFGLGTLAYFILEGMTLLRFIRTTDECPFFRVIATNTCFAIVLVVLQTVFIFTFPRLNLHCCHIIDRFGLMHLVATNVILWIGTLTSESLHVLVEIAKEKIHKADKQNATESIDDFFVDRIWQMAEWSEHCEVSIHSGSNDTLSVVGIPKALFFGSVPLLFPFVIEYALIGAYVFFLMWKHVKVTPTGHAHGHGDGHDPTVIHRPNPVTFLRRRRWLSIRKGFLAGLIIVAVASANLSVFFGLHEADYEDNHEDEAGQGVQDDYGDNGGHSLTSLQLMTGYTVHSFNIFINFCGIVAVVFGIHQTHKLRSETEEECEEDVVLDSLDLGLLRFAILFFYVYLVCIVIEGIISKDLGIMSIMDGIVEIIQITLQIVFIIDLKSRALTKQHEQSESRPGRQLTVFLFFLNMAQWMVVTFEIQMTDSNFMAPIIFRETAWIIFQRVTLPLAVFFRFHSAVVCIELAKEVYSTT